MYYISLLLGLLVGSFLNVVIGRLPYDQSVVHPPSQCPVCKKRIKPYDNIPVVSYILLKGKCRQCKSKISIEYPIVELFTGVMFGWIYLRNGMKPSLWFEFALVSLLIVVVMIDLKHEIIPDEVNLLLGLIGLVYIFIISGANLKDGIFGFLAGGGILFLIALVGPMGGGDIKFMAAAGLWLGLIPTFFTLLIAFTLGGLVGGVLLITKIKSRKDHIPFGPFLALSTFLVYFYYTDILMFYLKLVM